MTQPGLVKLLGATLVAFLTVPAAGALTPTPLPQEVVPRLTYELTVEPEFPIVGDTVSLTFAVGIGGIGGLPQFMLWVDGEALSGDVEPVTHEGGLPDSVTFTLDASGAGVAEVRLAVNYEAGVTVGGQCCIFQFVNDVSPVFQVPVIARGGAASPTPTATVAPSGVPGEHRIDVRVGLGEGTCLSGYPGRTVELFPTGRSASSDAQGRLAFDAVADGAYELRVVPPCSSGSCFPYTPVNVAGADLEVELCAPLCTPQLFLEPQAGSPGTAVALEGACQYIHSGGSSPLRFGPIALGEVHGNTAGDFTSGFTVPWVPPGVYAVSAADGVGLFEVTGEFPGCDGDCNGDLAVRIDELTRSVGIALRTADAALCPVFRDGASIAQLVRAVRAALNGCAAIVPGLPTPLASPTPTASRTAAATPTATSPPLDDAACERCCEDCTTAECFAQCAGHDTCTLVAEWSGVVSDALTGQPLAQVEVTVNGATARTDENGEYTVHSLREEVCTGLDYLYELSVAAPGYRTFVESFYRVPFPRQVTRDIELAPTPEFRAFVNGPLFAASPGA